MAWKLKADREINGTLCGRAGLIVYPCRGWDYGAASDDTRMLGVEHTSVTVDPDGGYPFFTVPVSMLERIP